MATRNLNDLYRRMITSSNRLQQLREMRAPDIVLRNENRILEGAVYALLDDDKIAQVIADVSANAFINYFNHIAGTEIRHPIAVTATASRAA
jgi:DNA-directed RNA polymerase subunit beta'